MDGENGFRTHSAPYDGTSWSHKKEANLTHETTWPDLEEIRLSEISQSQGDGYCMPPLTGALRVVRLRDRRRELARGRGEGGTRGSCLVGTELPFGKMKNVLEMEGRVVAQHYERT